MKGLYLCTLSVLFMSFMSACGNNDNMLNVSSEQQVEENKNSDDSFINSSDNDCQTEKIEPNSSDYDNQTSCDLDEESVDDMYKKAEESFGWFYLCSLACDGETESQEKDGKIYYRVEHPDFKTYNELKNYLLKLFSEPITNNLLESDDVNVHYCDINGALYATPGAVGGNIFMGNERYKLTKQADDKYIYTVTVEVMDDSFEKVDHTENYDFTLQYIDGKWLFTDFYIFR